MLQDQWSSGSGRSFLLLVAPTHPLVLEFGHGLLDQGGHVRTHSHNLRLWASVLVQKEKWLIIQLITAQSLQILVGGQARESESWEGSTDWQVTMPFTACIYAATWDDRSNDRSNDSCVMGSPKPMYP